MTPDVIVTWLQNDYGQLGRPSEAIAHALVDQGLARRVAYVEPNQPRPGDPELDCLVDRDLLVYRLHGPGIPVPELARAVIDHAELRDPILLNVGVGEESWAFHHGFGPLVERVGLVTYDVLHLWPGQPAAWAERMARVRRLLVLGSDRVVGLSEGSIVDVPGARYVGHACDAIWTDPAVDAAPEPADLSAIPHPRALYFGALSVRVEVKALEALADAGVHVVLVGFGPAADVAALIEHHPNVHFLGPRLPEESAAYLRHCDLGVVPHTDEAFTWSMEPHKLYNYACAGLRSVVLHCACPPALADGVTVAADVDGFVAACLAALEQGSLPAAQQAAARAITWGAVAERVLDAVMA